MKKSNSITTISVSAAVLFSSAALLGTFALSGCDSSESSQKSDSQATTSAESSDVDALSVPAGALSEEMLGQSVTVTGKVVEQCPATGCWLRVEATDGATFVDLLSSPVRLSQDHVGELAEVTGEVVRRGSALALQAQSVEFKSGIESQTRSNQSQRHDVLILHDVRRESARTHGGGAQRASQFGTRRDSG